ncbi:MAG: hypothetical protein ABSE73_13305 [Planctomycetota bacterium]
MNETASTTTAPAFCVERFRRRGWHQVSGPLPRKEAEAEARELKLRPEMSSFHVRIVPAADPGGKGHAEE